MRIRKSGFMVKHFDIIILVPIFDINYTNIYIYIYVYIYIYMEINNNIEWVIFDKLINHFTFILYLSVVVGGVGGRDRW